MTRHARESTLLAGFLLILRRHWLLIGGVAVICVVAALAASLAQKKSYQAQASLAVSDPNSALTVVGGGSVNTGQTPLELASSHAGQVTRQAVTQRVKAVLHSPLSLDALRSLLTVSVDPTSDLVDLTANAPTATEAAAIANAFANKDASLTTAEAQRLYAIEASRLQRRINALGNGGKDLTTRAIYMDQLARLQALASVATPVQVNTSARVPSSPSSPRPISNAIVALVIGLFLGFVLALGRETLDRRLRQATDVEDLLDYPVIGHVRSDALGHAGPLSVNGHGPLAEGDEESFRILRQNLIYLTTDDVLRTLLVSSAMPEEGKSTVAACLAAVNASIGKRTLIVECDLRRPVLAERLGLAKGPGLTDCLVGEATPAEVVQTLPQKASGGNGKAEISIGLKGALQQGLAGNLGCVMAGTPAPRPAELLGSDRFRLFIEEMNEAYEMVILDSPPILTVADARQIVPLASGLVICVRLKKTTRDQLHALHAALDRLPSKPVGAVLIGVDTQKESYYGYYSTAAA